MIRHLSSLNMDCLNFRGCVAECEKTGCAGGTCFPHCKFPSDGVANDGPWYLQEPLYLKWKQWDCQSDCRYNCMIDREKEREAVGHGPVKYHGKWPFRRVFGIQVCSFLILILFFSFYPTKHFSFFSWNFSVFFFLQYSS